MNTRPLRFGAVLCTRGPIADLVDQGQRAAESGCDVVLLPDHLGYSAPLSSLVAVAVALPSVRVGTCVLNTAFYRPTLLARELAAVDSATGGRLEIGLGAGYVAEEFATAGLRFPTPAERVQCVEEHVHQIRTTFADPDYSPTPVQDAPPIMIGGAGCGLSCAANVCWLRRARSTNSGVWRPSSRCLVGSVISPRPC
jgi:probable F420-dependent oxidoreductase